MKRTALCVMGVVTMLLLPAGQAAQEKAKPQSEQRPAAAAAQEKGKPTAAGEQSSPTSTQEKQKPPETKRTLVPFRVQVVFNEYEGEKKVSSLPYTILVHGGSNERSQLRMGLRVPVATGGQQGGPQQFQYMDVGTNIDAFQRETMEGYRMFLSFERTSLYFPGSEKQQTEPLPTLQGNPILRQFRGTVELLMRDGETTQATVATDPVSGRVLKVDVTLNVVK